MVTKEVGLQKRLGYRRGWLTTVVEMAHWSMNDVIQHKFSLT